MAPYTYYPLDILDKLEISESTREKISYRNIERLCGRSFFN